MKRLLIIANTYYQMIMAIQMNNTIFQNDKVALMLSDHSIGMDSVCNSLNKIECFDKVTYVKSKGVILARNIIDKISDYIHISFLKNNRYSYYLDEFSDDELYFDEIICFNFAIDIYGLYSNIYKHNRNVIVSLYEEGLFSYGINIKKTFGRKIINLTNKILHRSDAFDSLKYFYCMYPDLYYGNLSVIKVPKISRESECTNILRACFKLKEKNLNYNEKYIFFSSVYDFEGGGMIGEYDLVQRIANLVGRDNLIVKVHPRDNRGIYEKCGLKIDQNSSIPWEAIQMTQDFNDKVFLTATSGSVLAGSFLSKKPVKTLYLFSLCDMENNEIAQYSAQQIIKLLNNKSLKNVLYNMRIVSNIEEILQV